MACGRFVKGGGDDFAAHGAAHFGHFFRALVDEQYDKLGFGIIGGNRVGDVLQHHGFARFGRGNQECALAAADGGDEVDGAAGDVFFGFDVALELELFVGEQRREVFKQDFVAAHFGMVAVDGVEVHQGEVAFVVFRHAHGAFDGVAGVQVEAADLVGRYVNIVGAGEVGGVGAAQETEAVGQDFQCARAGEVLSLLHQLAHDGEDEVLFAQAVGAFDAELFGLFEQFGDVLGL
ncbi:hypothetical protein HMPREF9120_02515 [Neisseria sp. oral taxon 020 str. F0370]|nr:hypothetical protein HMPREF9120_02515 [Neisseria sp. oral taxon 020 str. F0370]